MVVAEVEPEALLLLLGAQVAAETGPEIALRLQQRQAPQILAAVAGAHMAAPAQQAVLA